MSSCRKPEIQTDLPKITKIKRLFFLTNSGQKSLTMFIVLTTIQLNFKNREIRERKKKSPSVGIEPAIPEFLVYRTPAQRKLPL